MTLVNWWLGVPERVVPKVPALLKAVLVPWVLLGLLVGLIPELQAMPDALRFVIGLPAALLIFWFAFGLFLSVADLGIRLGSRMSGKRHG